MSKALKWILGILGVLVVVAVVVGAGLLVVSHRAGSYWMMGPRSFEPFDGRWAQPWGDQGRSWNEAPQFKMPMHPYGNMPMMRRGWFPFYRFGGFFPLGLICGTAFFVVLAFFAVYGIIALARGWKSPQPLVVSSANSVAARATPAVPVESVVIPEETPEQAAACPNCGHEVQADWNHCPNCGQFLK